MAFVTDTFTDADGTALQSHTPDVGGAWSKYPGYTADAAITSNRLRGPGSAFYAVYTNGATPGSTDYDVQADLHVVSDVASDADSWAILGRTDPTVSAGQNTYYSVDYDGSANAWRLVRFLAGVGSVLGTYSQTLTVGQTYAVKLEMRGTTIKAYIDLVERISVTNSGITAANKAGLYLAVSGAATGHHLDRYSAEDYVVGSPVRSLRLLAADRGARRLRAGRQTSFGLRAGRQTTFALRAGL